MAAQDQQPIGSGFGAKSTASEVLAGIDLTGRNAIVTGGYSGLGLETVRALAGAGARVTVPARRVEVAEAALADVTGDIEIAAMDLADLQTVEKFTREYDETKRGLDILINNAGIMACQRADSARVVCLSSTGHVRSDVHWDDPHFNNTPYDKWDAYGQAKSANALFALGVDHRGRDVGVRAFSVHPGGIFTPLQRHLSDEEMVALGWKDCDIAKLADENSQRWEHARPWICDDEKAERLWSMSEKMLADA